MLRFLLASDCDAAPGTIGPVTDLPIKNRKLPKCAGKGLGPERVAFAVELTGGVQFNGS